MHPPNLLPMTSSGPRPVGPDDIAASVTLSAEAFGSLPAGFTPPSADTWPLPGRHSWGTWDGDRLVARVMGREYHSWWHGRAVPTCGIAAVAVAAERRGSGLLDPLMATVLEQGLRERGEVVSTLFPTAPGIYRRYGYEVVTSLLEVELADRRPGPGGAADPGGDAAAGHRRRRGRRTPGLRDVGGRPQRPADPDRTVVPRRRGRGARGVHRDHPRGRRGRGGRLRSWHRGSGYDDSSILEVDDLVSLHAGATRSLWALLGSHASVTGRVRLSTSGEDPVRLALPFAEWRVTKQVPYMLRVHDVPGALTGLRLGPLDARVPFSVEGDLLGTTDGHWLRDDGRRDLDLRGRRPDLRRAGAGPAGARPPGMSGRPVLRGASGRPG